jgi:hypothetical protein
VATNPIKIPAGLTGRVALVAAVVALAVAFAGCGGSSSAGSTAAAPQSHAAAVGNAPPEWAANTDAWPAHNYDLANTRATTNTDINSANVSKLNVKWRFALKGASVFGIFSSTPIVQVRHHQPADVARSDAEPLELRADLLFRLDPFAECADARVPAREVAPLRGAGVLARVDDDHAFRVLDREGVDRKRLRPLAVTNRVQ